MTAYEKLSESPLYSSGTMKKVLQELKDYKFRLSKLEDEVATLHDLIEERNSARHKSYSLSPPRILDFVHSLEDDDLRWSRELPRNDSHSESRAIHNAMMMNNQAWYGDAFLFEVMCQIRGYRPRENNWFNSVFPFQTISRFAQSIQSQRWFHHTCIISIGYSDLFRFHSLNDKRTKWLLHNILNHMRDFGAEKIKVLSIPPARQMMKNIEYLRLCQTNNRALQNVTDTHPGVEFINLDSFFLRNSDEAFTYFEEGEICVDVLDNLLMKKTDDKFFICVDQDTARCLVDHVVHYADSSTELSYISRKLKGCESTNDILKGHDYVRCENKSRPSTKRRREDSYSYDSDKRLTPDYRLDRSATPGSKRESPHRSRDFRYKSPSSYSDRKSPRKRKSKFNRDISTSSNNSQPSALDGREENLRHDRRKYANSYDVDNTAASSSNKFFSDSGSRSKRRDNESYEERIVSQSKTEVRYSERKSPAPPPPPPWVKNAPSLSSSSKTEK